MCIRDREKRAVNELIEFLKTEESAEKIQNAIFQIARKHEIKPSNFFKVLYLILLGTQKGPRLGPYMVAMGRESVIQALRRALE